MGLAESLFGICRKILRLELYDVNFGGNEIMTKRLTIALVALALFVLVAVMPVSASYYPVAQNVAQGATVFIGEQNLNLTTAVQTAQALSGSTSTTIGWWASAAQIGSTSASKTIDLTGRVTSFTASPADFVGYAGTWYLVNASGFAAAPVITAADPTLDIRVWDFTQGSDITGKSITQGEQLGFRVDTAMTAVFNGKRTPINNAIGNVQSTVASGTILSPATYAKQDGYIDIKVKTESGNTLTGLLNKSSSAGGQINGLTALNVTTANYFWGKAPGTVQIPGQQDGWATGATDATGQLAYQAGTYTIWAESLLNGMKDNYQNGGADYTTKTVSQTYTVTLVSDTVKIEVNKDTVVRSKPFSVTITGRPNTNYNVWVKGTSTMHGGYDDQPPQFQPNQAGTDIGNVVTGAYVFQNGGAISADVSDGANMKPVPTLSPFYANVTTNAAGTRTIGFITTNWTKAQKYTIRVEQTFGTQVKSDEVDVNVQKGAVTIVAAGDQSYYLGEEIKLSGTNTETQTTYLFIIGPNLNQYGAQLQSLDPRNNNVVDGTASSFQSADVLGDNTWSLKWGTSKVALDAGTYTIYAVSGPRDAQSAHLANVAYGTVSIIIKKPFISAEASASTVAQGDRVFITGKAEGQPSQGVAIWILGKNYAHRFSQSVNSDASFTYEIKQADTSGLAAGQYFVVVQHPMQNNVFDIDVTTTAPAGQTGTGAWVINRQLGNGTVVFRLLGQGSLQGSDAAEALVQGINNPNVDDTYTKFQFLVEVPVIRVDPVGEKHVGDKFTITATTNLAVDDDVLVTVISSSFKPTKKDTSGEFSGATGTVKVTKGTSGLNTISFPVDSSTFKPDEYLVTETGVLQTVTGTALFNVIVPDMPTPVQTTMVTGVTTVVTTVKPVTNETTLPTTTKAPGYGALIALIGLGAVAFIVVRRH
jgi:PGF-CTERM protein